MEQIFIIETLIEMINLKIEKTEAQIKFEAALKAALEAAAAAAAAKKKGKKGKKNKPKKGKKGKGKAGPKGPSEEEIKQYLSTCSVTMECKPIFNFYLSYDKFIPPPPSPKPPKPPKKGKGKGKGGKGGKGDKGGKKGKGKKGKAVVIKPYKVVIPPDRCPNPPLYQVGQGVVFNSRPKRLMELMKVTPIKINIWNREPDMECVGFVNINWDESFIKTLEQCMEEHDQNLDNVFRDSRKKQILTTAVEMNRPLQCESDLKSSGDVKIYIRLTCLGRKAQSTFINLPEIPRVMGRSYLTDADKIKNMEVERYWERGSIYDYIPVAYLYCAPEITNQAMLEVEELHQFENFKAPFTDDELAIMTMGIPKGRCGGINCPKRLEMCNSNEQFIPSTPAARGKFVNANDLHGPCGRLDCPLAMKLRDYIETSTVYKPCDRPCKREEEEDPKKGKK